MLKPVLKVEMKEKPIPKFQKLNFEGVDIKKVKNPIIKALLTEEKELAKGRRGVTSIENEWVIFID